MAYLIRDYLAQAVPFFGKTVPWLRFLGFGCSIVSLAIIYSATRKSYWAMPSQCSYFSSALIAITAPFYTILAGRLGSIRHYNFW
jgi:hypothetical protein